MRESVDEDCKHAMLHRIAQIQPYGALLAFDREPGTVFCCSENLADIAGVPPAEALGRPWTELLDDGDVPASPKEAPDGESVHHFRRRTINGMPVVLLSHVAPDNSVIIEIEPDAGSVSFDSADRIAFTNAVSKADIPEDPPRRLLEHVARITGFDRAMLYKFLPGYHGVVIDEITKPGVSGFLGLRFPAADIPANARNLYVKNMQRSIADTEAPVVNLVTAKDREAPDLSFSQLRAVHTAHITYLKNIGARSSFSVSILNGARLWGMVACHNAVPARLTYEQRMLCEELCRIVSMRVTDLEFIGQERRRLSVQLGLSPILESLDSRDAFTETLALNLSRVRTLFRADGLWLHSDDVDSHDGLFSGDCLPDVVKEFVVSLDCDDVYHTSELAQEMGVSEQSLAGIGGLLHIPFSRAAFLALFRKEQVETVNWAGKPEAIREALEKAEAYTPRRSFAVWAQEVRGRSEPWSDAEVNVAEDFQGDLEAARDKQRLTRRARLDGLTDVLNKATFDELLSRTIGESLPGGTRFAVMLLDLDHFKPVNDEFGHIAGDALLVQVARRLQDIVRGRDTVGRLGGDEFAILQKDLDDPGDVPRIAGRIVEEMGRPFVVEGNEIHVGASVGVAVYPIHGTEPAELLKKADTALYKVKNSGRNAFRIADDH